MSTLKNAASKVQRTKISGEELSKTYADHNGPGNIPKDEMWDIHTQFSDQTVDLDALVKAFSENEILGSVFTTGCYPEQSLPVLMYLLYKNDFDFEASVLANANAGGDNVHRGIILGMLAGAASEEIPKALKESLVEYESIDKEIEAFVKIISAE